MKFAAFMRKRIANLEQKRIAALEWKRLAVLERKRRREALISKRITYLEQRRLVALDWERFAIPKWEKLAELDRKNHERQKVEIAEALEREKIASFEQERVAADELEKLLPSKRQELEIIRNAWEKEICELNESGDLLKVSKKIFDQVEKLKDENEKKI